MTLADVSLRLGVSRKTILHLIPKLRGFKVGRQWRFDAADVEAFVESQKGLVERRESIPMTTVLVTGNGRACNFGWPGSERYR